MKLLAFTTALVFSTFATLGSVEAHSWLVKPVSRETGPRVTDGSIGCPNTTPGKSTAFAPGETIDVRYWRNNHLGGFIRWAISPLGNETAADFDDNVFFYTCRESGPDCVPNGDPTNRYAGDNSGDNTISCGDTITLPDWLDEGEYVLQWVWFGVGSSYGNIGWAEPQFVSCADIELTSAGSGSEPTCPTFVGGDRVTKNEDLGNDECFYFYTNSIESTQYKGSNDDYEQYYVFGKPSYIEDCDTAGGEAGNSTTAPSTLVPESSTPAPSPSPAQEPESASGSAGNSAVGDDSDTETSPAPGGSSCSKRKRTRTRVRN